MTARRPIPLTFAQILFFLFSAASLLALPAAGILPILAAHTLYAGALAACLMAGIALVYFLRKARAWAVYPLVFALALAYATFKSAPFPYRYGQRTDLRVKILSERRVRRGSLEFAARIKGVNREGHAGADAGGKVLFGDKILLRVPPSGDSVRRGDTLRVRGLFAALPFERSKRYALSLRNSGFNAVFEGYGRGMAVERRASAFSPFSFAHNLHAYVRNVNERLLPWPQSEFAVSLFTGNRDDLPEELERAFAASGTMHLLAVSGLHFGFLALFFLSLFRLFRLRPEAVLLLLAGVTVFYMIFIGNAPSVQRSAVMLLCGIAVFLFDRDRDYFNILAVSYDLLWCLNPLAVFNPGFLLSFAATFSLLFLAPSLNGLLERLMRRQARGTSPGLFGRFLAASLSVSAAVQVYLWPVLLHYFGSFPYINLAANIPLVPLAGLSLGLELAVLLVYPLLLPLAVVIAEANTVVITLILRLALLFGSVRPLTVEGFPGFVIPLYFVSVTAAVACARRAAGKWKGVSAPGGGAFERAAQE